MPKTRAPRVRYLSLSNTLIAGPQGTPDHVPVHDPDNAELQSDSRRISGQSKFSDYLRNPSQSPANPWDKLVAPQNLVQGFQDSEIMQSKREVETLRRQNQLLVDQNKKEKQQALERENSIHAFYAKEILEMSKVFATNEIGRRLDMNERNKISVENAIFKLQADVKKERKNKRQLAGQKRQRRNQDPQFLDNPPSPKSPVGKINQRREGKKTGNPAK